MDFCAGQRCRVALNEGCRCLEQGLPKLGKRSLFLQPCISPWHRPPLPLAGLPSLAARDVAARISWVEISFP